MKRAIFLGLILLAFLICFPIGSQAQLKAGDLSGTMIIPFLTRQTVINREQRAKIWVGMLPAVETPSCVVRSFIADDQPPEVLLRIAEPQTDLLNEMVRGLPCVEVLKGIDRIHYPDFLLSDRPVYEMTAFMDPEFLIIEGVYPCRIAGLSRRLRSGSACRFPFTPTGEEAVQTYVHFIWTSYRHAGEVESQRRTFDDCILRNPRSNVEVKKAPPDCKGSTYACARTSHKKVRT